MIKAVEFLSELQKYQGVDLYVGVEGFVPRKVVAAPESILFMSLDGVNAGDYVMVNDPGYNTVGSISLTNDARRGFTVKSVASHMNGVLMTFEKSLR